MGKTGKMNGMRHLRPERKRMLKNEIIFWVIYMASFFAVEKFGRSPVWIVHCSLDDMIPFWKGSVYFYLLWFPYIIITCAYYFFREKQENNRMLYRKLAWGLFPVLLFYLLVPNGLQLRPTYDIGNDFTAQLVKLLWKSDNPDNVCPSIHVILSVIMDRAVCTGRLGKSRPTRWISHVVMVLICISTMLLKQHSVIDVCTGFLYGILVWYGDRIRKKN
jgi:membrane-associated phospholipid phosphatase